MAIKFSGEFEVKKRPEEVYEFLTDPNRFAPLLPDFQGVSVEDATHFTVMVKVGISYIKGTAHVKLELSESDHPRRAQYKGQGSVGGGNVTMVAGFDLSPIADGSAEGAVEGTVEGTVERAGEGSALATVLGTKVNWQGEAQLFGRLTSVAGGLIEPLGKKSIQKLIAGLQAALA